MVCEKCNAVIEDDAKICPVCGKNPVKAIKDFSLTRIIVLLICVLLTCFSVFTSIKLVKARNTAEESASESELGVTAVETQAIKDETLPAFNNVTANETTQAESVSRFNKNASISDAVIESYTLSNNGTSVKYARISITKQKLKEITAHELLTCYNSRITSDNYSWFTIACDDNTGIVFLSSDNFAVYGEINDLGLIENVIGIITLESDGNYTYSKLGDISVSAQTNDTKNQSDASTENDSFSTVYITASGKKYHRDGCSYLSSSKTAISISDAKSKGYSACSRCKP
ncbi:MAG: hypothetical protein NC122_06010 [Faecalibacterium sp.]|nr:hypothetical protein [Ruminococcus sp.]MCM1391647.1 hypothetical protein [Ruminococcus sp.]MCM1485744.1 hypothetical protein [Faecalibacterium sp.]